MGSEMKLRFIIVHYSSFPEHPELKDNKIHWSEVCILCGDMHDESTAEDSIKITTVEKYRMGGKYAAVATTID